ncbi:hypothetical protein EPD83_013925 [Phycicoccus sp. CMS6Z-2]|nr:hypothetical protein [Phycicoccus flavus]
MFWVLVAVLVRLLVVRRWGGRGLGPGGARRDSAEQTLATRFAAGDIDEREYRARLGVLRAAPPDAG